jgi:cytochrome c peroxidase
MRLRFGAFVSLFILLISCTKEPEVPISAYLDVPDWFPAMDFPPDNEFTSKRYELGRRLFFEPMLSLDSSISCASCHHQHLSFADSVAVSPGVKGRLGERNAPSLANIGYHPYFMREGGVPTLEMQVLVPIQEHAEFDNNILTIADRLYDNEIYLSLSWQAYNKDPDPFVITRALATYERALISGHSPYDMHEQGVTTLTPSEVRGMELFNSDRTQCSSCHSGFNFTDYGFYNNGLYEVYADIGRMRLTSDSTDLAKFKTPSLRNVSLTAPYMHDGSMADLRSVLDHYNSGGANHMNKDPRIKALNLTESELDDLQAFLESLTDMNFVQDRKFQP